MIPPNWVNFFLFLFSSVLHAISKCRFWRHFWSMKVSVSEHHSKLIVLYKMARRGRGNFICQNLMSQDCLCGDDQGRLSKRVPTFHDIQFGENINWMIESVMFTSLSAAFICSQETHHMGFLLKKYWIEEGNKDNSLIISGKVAYIMFFVF